MENITTNSDGEAVIPGIKEYFEANPQAEILLSFTVSADGYQKYTQIAAGAIINSGNCLDKFSVILEHNPSVTVVKKDAPDDAKISAVYFENKEDTEGTQINLEDNAADYVPVGSYVQFTVENVDYYNISCSAQNGDEEAQPVAVVSNIYKYQVTSDFTFTVSYKPVTVILTVIYDSKTGTVTPSGDTETDNEGIVTGKVTVNKNDAETVFTITPEEHHVLSEINFNGTIYSNDTESENKLPELNEGKYQFPITNSELEAETEYELQFSFALDQYEVNFRSADDNGTVEATCKDKELSDGDIVEALSEITFTFTPKDNNYKLLSVKVNDEFVEVNYDGKIYTYTCEIEKDTTVSATFGKVDFEKFKDAAIDKIFVVDGKESTYYPDPNNSNTNDLVYYVNSDEEVTLSLNNNDYYISTEYGISKYLKMDAIFSGSDGFRGDNETYTITKPKDKNEVVLGALQIMEREYLGALNTKATYGLPGTITFKFDNDGPDIKDLENINEPINYERPIPFTVTDDLSGVKSVEAKRSYDNITEEEVTVTTGPDNNGSYSLQFKPVDGTCNVTYTVIATDNVGNVSSQDFTVSNDTQAPILSGKEENQPPILFKNNDGDFFHRLLNAISFGKLGTEKTTIDFAVSDGEGVGFGDSSYVEVMFVPDGKTVESDGNIIKTSEKGNSVSITADDLKGPFKGTIYYKLTDDLGNTTRKWQMITSANSNILSEDATSGNDISIVMIENIAPVISETDIKPESNDVIYNDEMNIASGDITFTIDISDADSTADVNDNSGLYSYVVTDLNKSAELQSYEYLQEQATDTVKVSTKDLQPNNQGAFQFEVSVTDNAGNESHKTFSVSQDLTSPVITDFEFDIKDYQDAKGDAFKAVEVTDYGFYFKQDVTVTVTAEDIESSNEIKSGLKDIQVYTVDVENGRKDVQDAEVVIDDSNGTAKFTIPCNFKGQIYARATDNVNNTPANSDLPSDYKDNYPINEEGYTHPDGTVVESLDKHSETSSIVISAPQSSGTQNNAYSYTYDLNENAVADEELSYPNNTVQVPLYNSDPTFDVTVSDSYSGIRNVKWTVIEGGASTSKEISVDNTGQITNNTDAQWSIPNGTMDANLVTQLTGSVPVTGNYNDMVLVVELTDRAGNVSYDYYTFGIDKTAPGISVSYDNNNADQRSGSTYFKADRTATIVVTERNFNSENVVVTVTRDGKAYPVALSWRDENGAEANGDGTRHITSIAYNADGDYTFAVSYTDRAQNQNTPVDYGSSVAPAAFTVDKTAPVITVSYNNNNAQNGKYFRAQRTATIVIAEHNFDVNRVVFTRTAALRGSNTALPEISWNHNGDVHTATINYNADGDYTFDITMDDMAGNVNNGVDYGASVAANDFTVDQTIFAPKILFSDKENNEACDDADKRSFNDIIKTIISVDDANYSSVNVSLTRIGKTGEASGNLVDMIAVPNGNGTVTSDNFPEEIENDGIYTLTVTLSDLAGNVETSEEEFTVNRYGSVFVFNEVLNTAVSKNYNKSIAGNAVITEYNADPISEPMIQVTRDGSAVSLSENVISQTGGTRSEEGWYQNVYTVPQAVFAQDGIYDIYISSKDKSGNTPEMSADNIYSDMSTLAGRDATFIVDATKPQIVNVYSDDAELSGESINENLEKLIINYEISDNIAIGTIEVYDGLTGSQIGETVIMDDYVKDAKSGESRSYTSYKGSFEIPDGARNDEVYFVITDKAGNIINTSSDNDDPNTLFDMSAFEFLRDITVSTNPFIRWYANRPLFWGTIGAAAAVVLGALLIVFLKKRKNNDKEESEG